MAETATPLTVTLVGSTWFTSTPPVTALAVCNSARSIFNSSLESCRTARPYDLPSAPRYTASECGCPVGVLAQGRPSGPTGTCAHRIWLGGVGEPVPGEAGRLATPTQLPKLANQPT